MTYFCVVIGCKTLNVSDEVAKAGNFCCPLHGASLKARARPQDLQRPMPEGATPNVVEAVSATFAKAQTPQAPVTLSYASAAAAAASSSSKVTKSAPSTSAPVTGGINYGGLNGFKCKHCQLAEAGSEHLVPLAESLETRDRAARFVAACVRREQRKQDALKGPLGGRKGYMVGVLQHGGTFYVAISGSDQCMPEGAKRMASKLGLFIVDNLPAQVTALGQKIDTGSITKTGVAEFFECAGPKLIGHILKSLKKTKPKTWCMTEMWCGPDSAIGHTSGQIYESCGNCKNILPMMLCLGSEPKAESSLAHAKPLEKKTSEGGGGSKPGLKRFG